VDESARSSDRIEVSVRSKMSDVSSPLLEDAQNFARQQVDAICSDQHERLRQAFDESLQQAIRRIRAQLSTELIGRLNQSVRWLRSSKNGGLFGEALLNATDGFCSGAALFRLNRGMLHLESTRNLRVEGQLDDIPIESAPAFAAAVETCDTIVALGTEREMSRAITAYFGEAAGDKFHLFPILSGGQISALLYTVNAAPHVEALELLAAVAGAMLEGQSSAKTRPGDLINIASARSQPEVSSWSRLSEQDQEVHRKAQRFARVQIARLRLYKSSAVKNGRAEGNLYTALKEELDAARVVFRREFIAKSGTMVDYLHLEVVQILANNEVELLGPNYPGPLA